MNIGEVLDGRFELEMLAGAGGMGSVFRARDRATGGLVAVKLLHPDRPLDAARFEREATLLSGLSHEGIVRYVAHGSSDSGPRYLAMEWLDGEDLQARLSRGRLPLTESVTLLSRVAEALGAAHARGVVHRDLKPANLFLVGGDIARPKILDFGIAWPIDGARMTQTGAILGTPGYIAPEQARSRRVLDARADVFALGCVLFECLTGSLAFHGEHVLAVLVKILFDEPPRVRDLRPSVPVALDDLVARMLSKEPDARPRDAAALAEELARIATSAEGSARETVKARLVGLTAGERRALSLVVVGVVLGVVPGGECDGNAAHAQTLGAEEAAVTEGALRRVAEAFGGRLELLVNGSAVIALAGVNLASDQAMKAAQCALALREHVGGRAIGLVTVQGSMTAPIPVGTAMERAARMLARGAEPAGDQGKEAAPLIAIDDVTAGLLDARFDLREIGAALFLLGERELIEGTRTLLGKPTPCVGRDRELRMLEQIFDASVEEPVAQAVLVTAPAGVGKSRLTYELVRRLRGRVDPASIWVGRGDSMRAGSPFGLLGQAIRGALGIQDGEPLGARRERLRDEVAARIGPADRKRVTEFLGEIIGVPMPDDDSVPLRAARRDAQLMGEQMRQAWLDLARAETQARPLVLVLEDLHWGDLSTVQAVDAALHDLPERPFLVFALARPSVRDLFPELWSQRGLHEIRLMELSPKASAQLVRHVLCDEVSPETVERLVRQADGNAFYLEELIRGTVERRGGALPETVVAMVQSRLEALDVEARRLLRAASIFGEVFWDGGVTALLGVGADRARAVSEALDELTRREILTRRSSSRFPDERELAFRHALLREGAYATLTPDDRGLGHKLAGEWLEENREPDPTVLAEHFERGGEGARAAAYYLRAAEQMQCGSGAGAAIQLAERGLACGAAGDLRGALVSLLCEASMWLREKELRELAPVVLSQTEEVMRITPPGSVSWSRAVGVRLATSMFVRDLSTFTETLDGIPAIDPSSDGVTPLLWSYTAAIFSADNAGRLDLGDVGAERQQELAARMPEHDPIAWGWVHFTRMFRSAYANENPWDGLRGARQAFDEFHEASHRRGVRNSRLYTGMNLWFLGALEQAERELRAIADTDELSGHAASFRPLFLVGVLSDRGALEEARVEANQMVHGAKERGEPFEEGRGRYALAGALKRDGDFEAAQREATLAADLLSGAPRERAAALVTLASITLAQGRAVEALRIAEEAMRAFRAMRACGWFRNAEARLVYAEALLAAGETERAHAAMTEARARLIAQAAKISDPAYRRSFLEDVPENALTLDRARQWLGDAKPAPIQGG